MAGHLAAVSGVISVVLIRTVWERLWRPSCVNEAPPFVRRETRRCRRVTPLIRGARLGWRGPVLLKCGRWIISAFKKINRDKFDEFKFTEELFNISWGLNQRSILTGPKGKWKMKGADTDAHSTLPGCYYSFFPSVFHLLLKIPRRVRISSRILMQSHKHKIHRTV